MKQALVTAVTLAALCTPAWAATRCTDPSGRVTLQDAPCEAGSVDSTPKRPPQAPLVQPPANRPPMGDAEYERKRAAERSREIDEYAKSRGSQIRSEIDADVAKCGPGGREPFIGASAHWIRNCSAWGEPASVHSTTTALGESQQWVYRRQGYLYLDSKGIVTAIQR